jgi:ATP-dependent DNA helicase RecQ
VAGCPELPSTARAQELLQLLAGPDAVLRPAQAAAIDAVVTDRRRALVVQRTGFGKSAVYFIATRMLRDAGAGPTLLVSPLLALMRDQVAAAARMGVASATINSTNVEDWSAVEAELAAGRLDLLCISPERLNHPGFARRILPGLAGGLGLLVVDEAHCISDWGHDFRPDYRRIRDAIANLPAGTPVVATTATANSRVCTDVAEQLGDDVAILRGPLDRESLHLGVADLPSLAERLAWLAQRIPEVPGTGIVYTLTVAQTALVAGFLQQAGVDAHAYSSETPTEDRAALEAAFKANEVKALVATSALGMGVDKPDVRFVYHLGAPPSPIAYYQQVGRAGRSVDRAEAWVLPGAEDQRIWEWFASVGLPDEPLVRRVLDALGDEPAGFAEIERAVDLRRSRLETLLKILDVDGAAQRVDGGWVRTAQPWTYDTVRVARVREARRVEADAMLAYGGGYSGCLMEFLRRNLDDPEAAPCGRCTACTGTGDPVTLDPAVVAAAVAYLRKVEVPVEARKQWPRGLEAPRGNIKPDRRAEDGRALCRLGDAGWGPVVEEVLATPGAPLPDELVDGIVATLKQWRWEQRPAWVTWIPKAGGAGPAEAVARRVGEIGRLPVHAAVSRTRQGRPQAELENSAHRCRNVWGAFATDLSAVSPAERAGPVLVVDDVYDSGWTMTVVAAALREAGTGPVLPLVLARR